MNADAKKDLKTGKHRNHQMSLTLLLPLERALLITPWPWLQRLRAFTQPLRGSGPRRTLPDMYKEAK
jgi:hypothetical protein